MKNIINLITKMPQIKSENGKTIVQLKNLINKRISKIELLKIHKQEFKKTNMANYSLTNIKKIKNIEIKIKHINLEINYHKNDLFGLMQNKKQNLQNTLITMIVFFLFIGILFFCLFFWII